MGEGILPYTSQQSRHVCLTKPTYLNLPSYWDTRPETTEQLVGTGKATGTGLKIPTRATNPDKVSTRLTQDMETYAPSRDRPSSIPWETSYIS